MRGKEYQSAVLEDRAKIEEFLMSANPQMFEYIKEHDSSKFVLFYKYITHSDIATFGKATQANSHQKNYLYYISTQDMLNVEENTQKTFQTAHQSNIGLKKEFYDLVGLPNPRAINQYNINDYMNVVLVNDSVEYFKTEYTYRIFEKMDRIPSGKNWNFLELDVKLEEGNFTPIDLHCAVHGIGTSQDVEFHKLRHHLFKGDTIIFLAELYSGAIPKKDNLFVIVEKNPAFFSVLGLVNSNYEKYLKEVREQRNIKATNKNNAVDLESLDNNEELTRVQQSGWRNMLAKEMMGYTQEDGLVFCPFTYITADFDSASPLFVASHIKGFKDKNTTNEEKYDINNGLLLCANADALFDKHLISINEKKELVFSFLIDNNHQLKSKLLLSQPIFTPILNEKRMEYLAYHKKVFDKMEIERRKL